MDGDLVLGLLMIAFWVFSSLIAKFGRKVRPPEIFEDEDEAVTPAQRGVTLQDALQDLAKQMGVEVELEPAEAPVASEHRLTGSEHQRTAQEAQTTHSEHIASASEHRRTASETRPTASEEIFEASEHQWSHGEHVRGDVVAARTNVSHDIRQSTESDFIRHLRADLTDGKSALARAMVLKEILGPPVSLRSPESDRF